MDLRIINKKRSEIKRQLKEKMRERKLMDMEYRELIQSLARLDSARYNEKKSRK